jgi:hypothetical protein
MPLLWVGEPDRAEQSVHDQLQFHELQVVSRVFEYEFCGIV